MLTADKSMNKTAKIILGVVVLVIIIVLVIAFYKPAPKEAIKIGFIGPLTGDVANFGQNAKAAVELAVDRINSERGINGKKLEVIYEDGKCDPKEATNVVNKLVNIDKVSIIVGGLCSGETLAAAPIVEQSKVVLLSYCSSNPNITNAGDYVFRDFPSDNFQGKYGAEFVFKKIGAKKTALLYCLNDWCTGLKDVFKGEYKKLGGEIVLEEGFEVSNRDFRTIFAKVKKANPDLVYLPSMTEAAITALKQAKELGLNVKFLGGDAWDDPKIVKEAGEAAENIMYSVYSPALPEDFKALMEKKTGSNVIIQCSPPAYDATMIIANTMKKVGTDSTKIKDELYKVKNYKGVSGMIGFDKNGDLTTASYTIKIIKDGKAIPYEE
jgi:branched-chain amino acid transport system substrate-binding protein